MKVILSWENYNFSKREKYFGKTIFKKGNMNDASVMSSLIV